jgi:choline dehydrogenase-like flavoprotein
VTGRGDEFEFEFECDYDYMVGAPTAGCVLAHRPTEAPSTRLLLLEAGGTGDPSLGSIRPTHAVTREAP